jgi:flagellar M-ring protein FliF
MMIPSRAESPVKKEGGLQQIKNVWAGLDKRKQGVVFLAGLAIIVSIFAMSRMITAPSMTLLYAGLESSAAGDVVRVLEQRRAVYEVRGGSIYVESRLRDELRMTLASEGLPANGGAGYELLDSLTGFGTTSQMFDAAYWRAKEGELARTIVASPHVAQARVHIAQNGSNPFLRTANSSASVSVVPSGAPVTPSQANAIRYLIASAVADMSVENVVVIDANGTLVGSADVSATASSAEDRTQVLRDRVLRLVEARVGAGNAVVEISVETVTESETVRQRIVDPESRVAISTDSEERTDNSTSQAGNVTVASNLPDGDAQQSDGSTAQTSETRERVNFEISETEHEILRVPGAVKRLTVAVLVNGLTVNGDDGGEIFQPRSDDEMSALRDLVASAVGFNSDRGDVITLKSMDLPEVTPLGTPAVASLMSRFQLDLMSLIQIGLLALVVLVLGLFVVRPVLTKSAGLQASELTAFPHRAAANETVLTGEIDDSRPGTNNGLPANGSMNASEISALPDRTDDPVERLRAMIGERQDETVEILRGWLEEKEENV